MRQHDPLLGTLVHEVAHMLRLEIDRRVKGYDLTRLKWLALETIRDRPNLTQTDLANEFRLGNATIGRLVDRLVSRRLVKRLPVDNDRRAIGLVITSRAADILVELDKLAGNLRTEILDGISETDLIALKQGLTKLKHNLRNQLAALPCITIIWEMFEVLEIAAFTNFGISI